MARPVDSDPRYEEALKRLESMTSAYDVARQVLSRARDTQLGALRALRDEAVVMAGVASAIFSVDVRETDVRLVFPSYCITLRVSESARLEVETATLDGTPVDVFARDRKGDAKEKLTSLTRILVTNSQAGPKTTLFFKTGAATSLSIPFVDVVEDLAHTAMEEMSSLSKLAEIAAYG